MNDTSEQEILTNLTNAHNALSDTVNKHIEFTTALEKIGNNRDFFYNSILNTQISITDDRIDKLRVHIIVLYICLLITMITVGWRLI